MKITFIGSGYVGLVSGAGMSYLGHLVTCLDTDDKKINKLKKLEVPIFEDGLEEYIKQYGNSERLNFKCSYDESLNEASAIFITVGTPEAPDGDANLEYIFDAVLTAAPYANPDCIFIIKSTVPPGTCSKVKVFLREKGFDYEVVSNPEFLREGSAIHDFMHPNRIIIGAESEKAFGVMRQIYKPFTDQGTPLLETDLNTSELIKYASNSFLAGKIAFINEMADLCEVIGADINKLSKGIGLDHRIGPDFLKAGPGFGGSCFPKDILALQHLTNKLDSDFLILDAIIKTNTNRPSLMMEKVKNFLGGKIKGKKIAVLGLTYKAGTDDLRNSPAIDLINLLWENDAEVVAYDPQGMKNAGKYFDDKLICANSALEAVTGADALIIATEWPEFASLDYAKIKTLLNEPFIVDLRNILDKKALIKLGYKCYFVGQKNG
mgnify:CR=1 FL=1